MSGHSRGPWMVEERDQMRLIWPEQTSDAQSLSVTSLEAIATVWGATRNPDANARLIAAAPTLLAALEDTLWMAEKWAESEHKGHPSRMACEMARAVIAKATRGKP